MPRVTGLRPERGGRVLVELDGVAWRTMPVEVAALAGLHEGLELDRPRLRLLRRELCRREALEAAARALRWRDLSSRRLAKRLEQAGVPPAASAAALETLARAGLVDDERLALARARTLAERDAGDAAIRFELDQHGLAPELVERALADLAPEQERAERAAARRGGGLRAARYLARKGFAEESIASAVRGLVADDP